VNTPDAWEDPLMGDFESGTNSNMQNWWTVFNDDVLNQLILTSSTNNPDLQIAAERIVEASVLRGVAKSYWYPQIAAEGSVTELRASEAVYSTLPPGKNSATHYSFGGSMGWELDLWGRVRRMVESSDATMQATIEDYRDTLVMLYGEVASQYIAVRTLQNRIELTKQSIKLQAETLQMTADRNRAGLVPDLDLYQAKMNLSQSRAVIPPLRIALAKSIHRLSVLVGDNPSSLMQEMNIDAAKIPVPPAVVTVSMPADLLRQRPDVRSAERRLAAQTALIGVKKAELYPTLTLPGMLRIEAYSTSDLDGDALSYGFGPGLRWNLFSAGRIRNEIKAEESRSRQAYLSYRRTVLRALEDVENSMVAIREERLRVADLRDAVEASSKSLELVRDLYKSGLTDFQNVLTTQQAYMLHQDELSKSEGNIAGYTVQLYRAFGGGWNIAEAEKTAGESPAKVKNADDAAEIATGGLKGDVDSDSAAEATESGGEENSAAE
jgi:NodT family efflux transporter outer membrane factor (OMF) lipoprotein